MHDIYEGMCAVGAVLAELAPRSPEAPALRLAERHLHLLAQVAADRLAAEPRGARGGNTGGAQRRPEAPLWLPEPCGGRHVLQ